VSREFTIAEYFVDRNLGDRTALITGTGHTTYAELKAMVNRMGNALRRLGVRRGDRVLLALSDGVAFVSVCTAHRRSARSPWRLSRGKRIIAGARIVSPMNTKRRPHAEPLWP
jgi:non-ribosomal peptide synthetase component E (peptide arylation enzyme)